MTKAERNQEIHRLYLDGITLQDIGNQFNLSKERIRQILREVGLDRGSLKDLFGSDKVYIGARVSPEFKEEIMAEAARQGISISDLTIKTFSEIFKRCREKDD